MLTENTNVQHIQDAIARKTQHRLKKETVRDFLEKSPELKERLLKGTATDNQIGQAYVQAQISGRIKPSAEESNPYTRNPYHVHDGEWGGFAPARWFQGLQILKDHSDLQKNVYEWDPTLNTWWRVWDNATQIWRPLTDTESQLLKLITA
jgi:hypothetical protein